MNMQFCTGLWYHYLIAIYYIACYKFFQYNVHSKMHTIIHHFESVLGIIIACGREISIA